METATGYIENTKLAGCSNCILLFCDRDLEPAACFLPRQKQRFCIPYCLFIFSCNMAANQENRETSREGTHIVSTDEMTGVQALEHKYPDKLPLPGQYAKMEFEYIRHGTISLIGFFDVATGRMEMLYLNSTRMEEDFVEAVKALA